VGEIGGEGDQVALGASEREWSYLGAQLATPFAADR